MSHTVFFPLIPEYLGEAVNLPTCPDGSGDLWWDEASYIRYQTFDPGADYEPEHVEREALTDGFCDGVPTTYYSYLHETCTRHQAIYDRDDCPF